MTEHDAAIDRIGAAIDRHAARAHPFAMRDVAREDAEDRGVPPEMQVGDVDEDGWVVWSVLPSHVDAAALAALENELGVALPRMLRAYLSARSHLFEPLRSPRHHEVLSLACQPSDAPLAPFRSIVEAWRPLLGAGLLPFGTWGDGYGPMCLDVGDVSTVREDAPVVWIDHEVLVPMSVAERATRAAVAPHACLLYESLAALLADVFAAPDLVGDAR